MACPVQCHLFRSPWGCRAKCPMLCMLTVGFLDMCQSIPSHSAGHTVCPLRLPPSVQIHSLTESHTCHTQLALANNQILAIPTWGYDISIECAPMLNTYEKRGSLESVQTVNPPVALCILRIRATNNNISIANPKIPHHMLYCGHIRITTLAIDQHSLTCLTK